MAAVQILKIFLKNTTIAGTGVAGYSGDYGQATSAQLKYPMGLSADTSGNLFIADYNNQHDVTDTTTGTIYPDVPSMTINIKTNGVSEPPLYIPQKEFVSDANGNYPTKTSILPDSKTTKVDDGYTYETHIIMDMYIDKNNTTSWIYYKVDLTLYIFDPYGTKLDTITSVFNLNLKSITK